MRAATTRIQHLSVAPAKVATALPQWTTTTKPRKLQPAHRCPRNRKLLRTALNSTQQSLPRYTVGASLAHLLQAKASTPTSRPCLGTHHQLTLQQTTRSRTDLSEMHPSLNASFNSLDRLRAKTPDALTGTFAPKPETASLDHVVDPVHVKISCHQYHPSRLVRSRRSHRPSALRASFHRRQAVHHLRLRYHVNVQHSSATMLEFVTPDSRVRVVLSLRSGLVLSLVVCGEVGPSTASLANQAPVYCGCPAGTHGCDLVSRVRLDQSANPVVVWLGLVSRVREVIMETWNMRISQHPSSTRSWSRAGRLWDHHSNLTSTLRS